MKFHKIYMLDKMHMHTKRRIYKGVDEFPDKLKDVAFLLKFVTK